MTKEINCITFHILLLISLLTYQSCKKCDDPMIDPCDAKEPYSFVEQMPQYPGGQDSLNAFIKSNLIYPEKSKQEGVEGMVTVKFVVNLYGNIECIKILNSLNTECDNESLRLVHLMPLWNPGKHNGSLVDVSIVMNIEFKL